MSINAASTPAGRCLNLICGYPTVPLICTQAAATATIAQGSWTYLPLPCQQPTRRMQCAGNRSGSKQGPRPEGEGAVERRLGDRQRTWVARSGRPSTRWPIMDRQRCQPEPPGRRSGRTLWAQGGSL